MKRKLISFFTLICTLLFSVCFFACDSEKEVDIGAVSVTADDTTLAIDFTGVAVDGELTLASAMEQLQEGGRLSFTLSSGMVIAVNGKANTATEFWMLYTSDEALSNAAYGSFSYDGKTLYSAIVGADSLTVKTDELYVWVYETPSW